MRETILESFFVNKCMSVESFLFLTMRFLTIGHMHTADSVCIWAQGQIPSLTDLPL